MNKTNRIELSLEDRQQLKDLTGSGTMKVRALKRAQIFLKADSGPDGPAWSDGAIADALDVVPGTVANVRRRYVERGLASTLGGRYTGHNHRVVTGEVEAHLIALSCCEPPTGRERWTLQLLADKLVELQQVKHISDETVRQTLKKTTSSRG
ncbi:MAG: helix-turn-helix domain-containing protein [Chloroflexi bacterium]|nr:helix-turn-helix domain-containing protein [Chloroflexota bacterium]